MGGKRVQHDSNFQFNKCAKRYHGDDDDDDRISQLPDDILLSILSFLPLKEAARTSILSSRWIKVWEHTPCLNFHADKALCRVARKIKLCNKERQKYVKWVNRALQSHKSPTLEQFTIYFDLDISFQNDITRWLEFAFARRVQSLELNLLICGDYERAPCQCCDFPQELLSQNKGEAFPLQTRKDNIVDLKSLKTLSLKSVNVSSEAIEFFLRNCPFLERLVVDGTGKISTLEVCGPSLRLKHLELCYCYGMKSVKVSAPNLTSLTVMILKGLFLENVPMLIELSVNCESYVNPISNFLPALSCCISRLEFLALELHCSKEEIEQFKCPQLPKLKKLVVEYSARADESLIALTSFIRAAPYLEEFVLRLTGYKFERTNRDLADAIRFPHEHLKVVEFYGYYGRSSDLELVKYILENCIALEKITIDPHQPESFPHLPVLSCRLDAEKTSRDYAKRQLEGQVPQHIELVIP